MKKKDPEVCRKVKENVSALLDGELAEDEKKALITRIEKCAEEGCRECLDLLEDIRSIDCICKSPDAECNPPAEVIENLRERLLRTMREDHKC
jgi:hypothetical protein